MPQGKISKLTDKRFGFITLLDGGEDAFFHEADLVNRRFTSIARGDQVTYDVEDTKKGLRASNVEVL